MVTDDARPQDTASHDDDDRGAPVPRPRPGYRTPEPGWSVRMSAWAPVTATMLRAITGVVAFLGTMLAMPVHHATPFLVGVSLVMVVGGCTSTLKVTRDDPRLRGVGRTFTIVVSVVVLVGLAIGAFVGPGAFAPRLEGPPRPARDDGTVRFEY